MKSHVCVCLSTASDWKAQNRTSECAGNDENIASRLSTWLPQPGLTSHQVPSSKALTPAKTCEVPLRSSFVPTEATPGNGGARRAVSDWPEPFRGDEAAAGGAAATAVPRATPAARMPRQARARREVGMTPVDRPRGTKG